MLKEYPPLLRKESELIEAWRKTLQAFDQFTEQNVKRCFFHMKMKVMLRILHHLSEENKLSVYDERIFEYFDHLTNYYQMTIKLFYDNEQNIKTGKAKEILSGICTVLSSQLKQFRENQMVEQGMGDPKSGGNPIKVEKDRFITEQKVDILHQLDDLQTQWSTEKIQEIISKYRKNSNQIYQNEKIQYEIVKEIYAQLIEDMKESLYKTYMKKSKKGIEKLNDFHLRKAANFYYESIKQEKENVEAIIKIQVNALEEEMKIEDYEEEEQQIIQAILHTIREAYQHLGKEIEELEQFFKEAEQQSNKINVYSLQEFEEYLTTQGRDSYILDLTTRKKVECKNEEFVKFHESYDDFNQVWKEFRNELLNIYLEEIGQKDIAEKMSQKVQKNIEMAQKITELFVDFHENHEIQDENLKEVEVFPIIQGISETISIKIESLKESIDDFANTMDEFLENIKEEIKEIEKEYAKLDLEIYEKFTKEFIKYDSIEETVLREWLDQEEEEGFAFFTKKINRKYEKIEQEVDKKNLRFLREYLLFEMSTYEEIVYYSVSRLREEKDDFTVLYVKDIDELTKSLEEILNAYKIEFIHPAPHERFNGKQHEVLMAEVKEGFEKGEIIKTMNRGYIYNNQIVLKANVIAGK